ncbi:MAG TPA: GFA family protein [Xanthomonadales bacterium]
MNKNNTLELEGGCTCGELRYRLTRSPIYVHCCHCRWCQRETGSAFALNAMIESDAVDLLSGHPERVLTPSNSGKGQMIVRCPKCFIAVWSHYAGAGDLLSFIRVGTLDNPDALSPDVHIFTASKQPWVILPPDTPAFEVYYKRSEQLPAASLERLSRLTATK